VPAGADPGRRESSAGYTCRHHRTTTSDAGSIPAASISDKNIQLLFPWVSRTRRRVWTTRDSISPMRRRIKVWAAALSVATAVLVPAGASACPCSEFCGHVVAHGSSLYGVPWRITAATRPSTGRGPSAEIHFSIGACGEYSEAGYFGGMYLPLPRGPFFQANSGIEIDAYPEGDLSGRTGRGITKLSVKMDDGETLAVEPQRAPVGLRRDLPWLNQLRFFDKFFPADQRPTEIVAFDKQGRILGRGKSARGSFAWAG
jgi:hypothetical protein